MGRNIILIIILSLIISCANLPSTGQTMKTGDEVKPPQGYLDLQNRVN